MDIYLKEGKSEPIKIGIVPNNTEEIETIEIQSYTMNKTQLDFLRRIFNYSDFKLTEDKIVINKIYEMIDEVNKDILTEKNFDLFRSKYLNDIQLLIDLCNKLGFDKLSKKIETAKHAKMTKEEIKQEKQKKKVAIEKSKMEDKTSDEYFEQMAQSIIKIFRKFKKGMGKFSTKEYERTIIEALDKIKDSSDMIKVLQDPKSKIDEFWKTDFAKAVLLMTTYSLDYSDDERTKKIYEIAKHFAPSAHRAWRKSYNMTCSTPAYNGKGERIDVDWNELSEGMQKQNIEDLFLTITLVVEPLVRSGVIDPKKELTEDEKRLVGMLEHIKWSQGSNKDGNDKIKQISEDFFNIYRICTQTNSIEEKIRQLTQYCGNTNPLQGKYLFLFENEYENIDNIDKIGKILGFNTEKEETQEDKSEETIDDLILKDATRIHAFLAIDELLKTLKKEPPGYESIIEAIQKITIQVSDDSDPVCLTEENNPHEFTLRHFSKIKDVKKIDEFIEKVLKIITDNGLSEKFNEILNEKVKIKFKDIISHEREKSYINFDTVIAVERNKDYEKVGDIIEVTKHAFMKQKERIIRLLKATSNELFIEAENNSSKSTGNREIKEISDHIGYGGIELEKLLSIASDAAYRGRNT